MTHKITVSFLPGLRHWCGVELWKFDGTTATRVQDLNPGPASSNPGSLTVSGVGLYFSDSNGVNGTGLWRFDGTNIARVADINRLVSSATTSMADLSGVLFFAGTTAVHGTELWRYGPQAVSGAYTVFVDSGQIITGKFVARAERSDDVSNPRRYFPIDFGLVMIPDVLFRTPAFVDAVIPGSPQPWMSPAAWRYYPQPKRSMTGLVRRRRTGRV